MISIVYLIEATRSEINPVTKMPYGSDSNDVADPYNNPNTAENNSKNTIETNSAANVKNKIKEKAKIISKKAPKILDKAAPVAGMVADTAEFGLKSILGFKDHIKGQTGLVQRPWLDKLSTINYYRRFADKAHASAKAAMSRIK